jgi:hypothetical protein
MSKRTRESWATTSDPELYELFQKFVASTRIPKSRLVDEAIEDLLLKYKVIEEKTKTP